MLYLIIQNKELHYVALIIDFLFPSVQSAWNKIQELISHSASRKLASQKYQIIKQRFNPFFLRFLHNSENNLHYSHIIQYPASSAFEV
jgi:hypothetical protein